MGCASSNSTNLSKFQERLPTKTGFLRIFIQSAHIQHQTSSIFKMDPYVKINMNHQKFQTKTQLKGGADPKFNQTFQFAINSCYKKYGRNLQVQIWDKNKISDSLIGYGIIDLDPIIKLNKINERMKCFVNFQRKLAGYVFIVAQFRQCPSQILSFRFQQAFLRRKIRTIGDMNVRVKVTIGQQILQTTSCKDSKSITPKWINQILVFEVPTLLKEGKIQLMDQNNLIGDINLNINQLLQGNKQKQFNEDIFFQQKSGKDGVAGQLKYSTLYGIDGNFSQIQNHKKKNDSKIIGDKQSNKNLENNKVSKKMIKQESISPIHNEIDNLNGNKSRVFMKKEANNVLKVNNSNHNNIKIEENNNQIKKQQIKLQIKQQQQKNNIQNQCN